MPPRPSDWATNSVDLSSVNECRRSRLGRDYPSVCANIWSNECVTGRSVADVNRLRIWIESRPTVPDGEWYKDFGSFKLCGEGKYPKTFLLAGQSAAGVRL